MRTALRLSLVIVTPLFAGGAWIVAAAVVPGLEEHARLERTGQAPSAAATPPPPLPACDRLEHRQFDFWVGEWDVRPAGQPDTAPTPLGNVVRLEDGGCVVTEHWTTPRMTGRSVNIFDRTRGQWHQTWVDSTGGLHEYWGAANAEGQLVFHGSTPVAAAGNARQSVRLTFFNLGPDRTTPDRVRQFSEVLGADGRWTTSYDLIYTRRRPAR
jgi:hypothetical protein